MSRWILFCLALLAVVPSARAGLPDPGGSHMTACFIACPLGDFSYQVTVLDFADNPSPACHVVIEFCNVSPESIRFCANPQPCQLSGTTGPDGRVTFNVKAGGVDSRPNAIIVYGDGVNLMELYDNQTIASPDQNGDGVVNAHDLAIGMSLLGSTRPTMDLNCSSPLGSGLVDQADVDVILAHMGHSCGGPVPARLDSWGRVKILYR